MLVRTWNKNQNKGKVSCYVSMSILLGEAASTSQGESQVSTWVALDFCLKNSRSLLHKLTQFQSLIFSSGVSIVACTETWFSPYVLIMTIFRKDRDGRGGGVLLAIKNFIPWSSLHCPDHLEVVSVLIENFTKTADGVVYCPPNSYSSYSNDLVSYLQSISNYDSIFIMGDFNAPGINWSSLCGNSP